jgi:hypothetical protein
MGLAAFAAMDATIARVKRDQEDRRKEGEEDSGNGARSKEQGGKRKGW